MTESSAHEKPEQEPLCKPPLESQELRWAEPWHRGVLGRHRPSCAASHLAAGLPHPLPVLGDMGNQACGKAPGVNNPAQLSLDTAPPALKGFLVEFNEISL